MKKTGVITILAIVLTAILALGLVACGGGKNGETPINKIDFGKAGISGGFTADVSGDLKISRETDDGIELKWEKSNEQSFNNVITWLKDGGYDKYDGANATKESHPNGSYTMYCSDKTVNGGLYEATSIFFHKDANMTSLTSLSASAYFNAAPLAYAAPMAQEVNFKANDLYVIIEPVEDNTPSVLTEWPTNSIAAVLGANRLPVYAGTASEFSIMSTTIGVKMVTITITGAGANDETGYKNLLTSSGYAANSAAGSGAGGYRKYFGDDYVDVYGISGSSSDGVSYTIVLMAQLVTSSGSQTSWPTTTIAGKFGGGAIPAFAGASSFDVEDQSVSVPPYVDIPLLLITAYGVDQAKINTYKTALTGAGFTDQGSGEYQKDATSNQVIKVVLSGLNEGQVLITITRVDKENGGNESRYTLPQNIKVAITASGMTNTIIKVGDDYYSSLMGGIAQHYYKYNAGTWTHYEKGVVGDWEIEGIYNAAQMTSLIEGSTLFNNMTYNYSNLNLVFENQDTVAGVTVDKKSCNDQIYGNMVFYIDNTTGLVLQLSSTYFNFAVTQWQTSNVTFDGIQLPA